MRLREADVIVVGAGPAGSAAAIALATRGAQVVLLDRSPFPRPKVCGDGLTPRALGALRRLGAWGAIEPHSQVVDGLRTLHLHAGLSWDGPLPGRLRGMPSRGAVVRREVLDELLRQHAVALGASFVDGVAVDHVEQSGLDNCIVSGRYRSGRWVGRARAVVLATGVVGTRGVSQAVSRPALEGIALRQYWANVSVASAFTICIPLEVDSCPQAGYGWIFPVSESAANVGIGLYGVRDGRYVRRAYDTFVARLRDLDGACWSRAEPCGGPQGGRLRSGVSPARMVRGRIVCAGDAAAVANPFTGEGIAQALDSGELVALALLEEFGSPGRLEYAVSEALEEKFPHTRRMGEHLPWLASRGQQFVAEFWGAISPPSCIVSAAVRRVALEEQLDACAPSIAPLVERTWRRMMGLLENEYPLLAQLCEAVRAESQHVVNVPLQAFWKDHRERQADEIALMLGLGATICVIASEVREGGTSDPHVLHDQVSWAVQAIALGATDVLMAQFFKVAAQVPSAIAYPCARAVTHAFGQLSACVPVDRILATMASEFGLAARAALPEAA